LRPRTRSQRSPVLITLLDGQNHHCFQPLLYQVATAALSPADVAWPIRGIVNDQRNIEVLMAAVTEVDTAARLVRTNSIVVPYDYLVIATGATHSYFGHDEWAPVAPGLKRIDDGTDIRRRCGRMDSRSPVSRPSPSRWAATSDD
jgi:NADH dehydrogenase